MSFTLVIILALMIPLLAVVLDSQIVRALASRLDPGKKPTDSELEPRLAALEAELERLVQDVRRLEEETQFTQQLLENRTGSGGTLPPGETGREPNG